VRRVLLIVLLAAGAALAGGVGYGFLLYDQATRPDRSSPEVTVDNYLRGLLVERDDVRAGLYACQGPRLDEIRALRTEAERRERDFGVTVRTTWGALRGTRVNDGQQRVQTRLTISGISGGQVRSERMEMWDFTVVDDDGWRVCGAAKITP
jgi:hypothetical protein